MEDSYQDEPMDLSMQTAFECPKCCKTFQQRRYLIQHEKKHKPPEAICNICQPPVTFKWRNALINHRAKVHRVLPYLCAEEQCEKAFATNAELKEHGKEKHTKCDRCNGEFLNPAGLKLHQKKCVDLDAENLPSVHSIDSGLASDESRDSRISEISNASSSFVSNVSRHPENSVVKMKASCSKSIREGMRRVMFGLPTASVALIRAYARGIRNVDDEILKEILNEGQSLFGAIERDSASERSVSPSQIEGRIRSELSDVTVELTFSPGGVPNPHATLAGSLNREELFQDLKRFSKESYHLGVLQVGEFYMALVFENSDLYVVNPGIGSSREDRDLSGLPLAMASLKKCHSRGWHLLVDDLIDSFKLENACNNDQLKYDIMPVFISRIEDY